jgi:hypothetical protein
MVIRNQMMTRKSRKTGFFSFCGAVVVCCFGNGPLVLASVKDYEDEYFGGINEGSGNDYYAPSSNVPADWGDACPEQVIAKLK